MVISNIDNITGAKVENKEAKNVIMKVLISASEGWNDYVMRVFEIAENGYTPKHSHPWQHIIFVISGEGELFYDGKVHNITTGSYAFVESNKLHQFKNIGKSKLKFICIVPKEGHK